MAGCDPAIDLGRKEDKNETMMTMRYMQNLTSSGSVREKETSKEKSRRGDRIPTNHEAIP